jgi:hypothetical protein
VRYLPFILYSAVTIVMLAFVVSDLLFRRDSFRRVLLRILLVLIWPLAALNRAGREILFRSGRNPR